MIKSSSKFLVALKGLLFIFSILLLIFGSWVLWERNRDALTAIDFYSGKVELSQDTAYHLSLKEFPERSYRHITLTTEYLDSIEAFISQPKIIPAEGLPVVIIMGGLEVDTDTFKLIPDPGENIYIVFKYPYTPEYWKEGSPVVEILLIRKKVLRVPSQVLSLYEWVSKQLWTEKGRVTFAGFSLGAMFLPAVYHLADSHDTVFSPGIIAYAGVDISDLLYMNMKKIDPLWRSSIAWLGETAIYGIEPARHLPYMNNEFLLINGVRDHQIPIYSWKKLHRSIPQPKTLVILDEGHMHPRKPELTKKVVKISREWLQERKLIN